MPLTHSSTAFLSSSLNAKNTFSMPNPPVYFHGQGMGRAKETSPIHALPPATN
jgi:hypothetical protein